MAMFWPNQTYGGSPKVSRKKKTKKGKVSKPKPY